MQRFNELASHLLSGREIEFVYNGKQYSITNSKGRWMLYCDTDKLLLKDICDFEEREILVKNVGAYEISGRQIADIFDDEADFEMVENAERNHMFILNYSSIDIKGLDFALKELSMVAGLE